MKHVAVGEAYKLSTIKFPHTPTTPGQQQSYYEILILYNDMVSGHQ